MLKTSLEGIDKLTLDFSGLSYLSSAGLRVVLLAQKYMSKHGKMIVKNVNETIMDVLRSPDLRISSPSSEYEIAYVGIDALYPALPALAEAGCEIGWVFSCETDNVTEFNLQVCVLRGSAAYRSGSSAYADRM